MRTLLSRLWTLICDALQRTADDDREAPPAAASLDELRDALERRIAEDEGREG
jgi:hypothetical protein